MSHTQLNSILSHFNPELHDTLARFAAEQLCFEKDRSWLQQATGYDITRGQHPTEAEIKCSDSRVSDPIEASAGAGVKLSYRCAGGFGTDASGTKLNDNAEEIHELAGAYGVPFIKVGQHSDCGAMRILYTYYSREDGPDYVLSHYGPGFHHMADNRENLFFSVDRNIKKEGFSYYEKLGLWLGETEESKYQTCLSVEEGLRTVAAINAKADKFPNLHLPKPIFLYKHIIEEGHYYCFDERERKFIMLPQPSKTGLFLQILNKRRPLLSFR